MDTKISKDKQKPNEISLQQKKQTSQQSNLTQKSKEMIASEQTKSKQVIKRPSLKQEGNSESNQVRQQDALIKKKSSEALAAPKEVQKTKSGAIKQIQQKVQQLQSSSSQILKSNNPEKPIIKRKKINQSGDFTEVKTIQVQNQEKTSPSKKVKHTEVQKIDEKVIGKRVRNEVHTQNEPIEEANCIQLIQVTNEKLIAKIKKKIATNSSLKNDQSCYLKCRSCLQSNYAPNKSEDLLQSTDAIFQYRVENLYTYLICIKCSEAIHFGCLPNVLPNGKYEVLKFKDKELDQIVDVDQKNPRNISQGNKPKEEHQVILYNCDSCTQNNQITEDICFVCLYPNNGVQMSNVLVEDVTYKVHSICANSLPSIFKLSDDQINLSCSIKDFELAKIGSIVPKTLKRSNDSLIIEFSNKACNLCFKTTGFRIPCSQNYKNLEQEQINDEMTSLCSCSKVVHPYCVIKQLQLTETSEQETLKNWELIYRHKVSDDNNLTTFLQCMCSKHANQPLNCYGCEKDPELTQNISTQVAAIVWVSCDFCNTWYHDICVKNSMFKNQEQQVKFDESSLFKCELCSETEKIILGDSGKLINKQIYSTGEDFIDFINIDRRSFKDNLKTQKLQGQPQYLQLSINFKLWLAITKALINCITTESLLQEHSNKTCFFTTNVSLQQEKLSQIKIEQAKAVDTILYQTLSNEYLNQFELQKLDVIDASNQLNQEALQNIQMLMPKYQQFHDKLKNLNGQGHLKGNSELAYLNYKQLEILSGAASLIKQGKFSYDSAQTLLKNLKTLNCEDLETFKYFESALNDFINWKLQITEKFYKSQKSKQQLVKQITNLKEISNDQLDLVKRRLKELRQIFVQIPKVENILASLGEQDSITQGVDDSEFRQEINENIIRLQNTINAPRIPDYKPLQNLLEQICGLACEPYLPDVEPILQQYHQSVIWMIKIKEFIGKRENWINFAQESIQLNIQNKYQIEQLGEIPNQVVCDANLFRLAALKSQFIKYLKQQRQSMLEDEEILIPELEKYIEKCKSLGNNAGLELEMQKVQQKIDLIKKVLKILGGDQNYEERLQSVTTDVIEAKIQQKINIRQDLESMLEAKVQIVEELRREFSKTLARCADSFNKQLVIDLRKILQKATKDHQLHMEKEKRIVDSLQKSEEWFISTFAKLKVMCGPQLHQIDFKDFSQLHGVIKNSKDCDSLLRLPPNIKPENLVAAAWNLYHSLQGAKWIFEVRNLMQADDQQTDNFQTQPRKELSHLLMLHYKAKELQINISQLQPEEYILTDDDPNPQVQILQDFEQLSQIAVEFDAMFGNHQKIIATLERHEQQGQMQQLIETVDRIQQKLVSIKFSNKCQISPANELEILSKVRTYIQLNEDYQLFISSNQQDNQVSEDKNREEIEIDKPEDSQQKKTNQKISYQKALKLQRQARESQIPDDIPVLRRLNQSVLKFEKFRRECSDYYRFRERIKQKGYSFIQQTSISPLNDKQDASSVDSIYNIKFVRRLLDDSDSLDIEIPIDNFDPQKLREELEEYNTWKAQSESTLKRLEQELQRKSDLSLNSETALQFERIKEQIGLCPVYNQELFMKIHAFEWVYNVCRLLNNVQDKDQTQILNLTFWQNLYDQQINLLSTLPQLKDHAIIQRMLWEIDQAKTVIEFVKDCKNTQRALSGKFVQMQRGKGADNYMIFKNKYSKDKLDRIFDISSRVKVDITTEIQDLNQWVSMYQRYKSMAANSSLWEQGYEKVKTIQRNIFQSPFEFGQLYFEIEKRLTIAEEIRKSLKLVFEESQKSEKRIKISSVSKSLRHFNKNCQITQIPEVERIQKQIKISQEVLAQCEEIIEQQNPDLALIRKKILEQIIIDLEAEELPLRKEVFELTVKQITRIPHSAFKLLEKDYQKLRRKFQKVGLELRNERFEELRQSVGKCLKQIKDGNASNIDLPDVDFSCTIADREAKLYILQQKCAVKGAQTQLVDDNLRLNDDKEDVSMNSDSSSSSSESSSSKSEKNSQDSTSSLEEIDGEINEEGEEDGGEDEMSENHLIKEKEDQKSEKEKSQKSSADSESIAEEGEAEQEEEVGLANSRNRREIKPNFMDDHIYFVKKPIERPPQSLESRSQLLAKRQAKIAAKEFEREKHKIAKIQAKEESTPLDFSKFSIIDDEEALNSINQMKIRIRNQSRTSITTALKQHQCFGDQNSLKAQNDIREITQEVEDLVEKKFTMIDQQYRSKIQDVCRNIEQLKKCQEIAELYFTKKSQPLNKLLNSSINFSDNLERQIHQRKIEQRKQQMQRVSYQQQQMQKNQNQGAFPGLVNSMKPLVYPSLRPPQLPSMIQVRPPRPVLPMKIKTSFEQGEEKKRRDSLQSVESLQSNPAQFSDDELNAAVYDPTQIQKPTNQASFLCPPPGVSMQPLSYNPTFFLQQFSQQKVQKDQILYDPIAHANQPIQSQQVRITQAKPGSLLKVYNGCLDTKEKDCQFNITLCSFQDVKLFQKLPQPAPTLSIKGKSDLRDVCNHFLRVLTDPMAGQLLKGYAQRQSYLNAELSERYQKFYDNIEQTQKAAVFHLYEGVTLYLIPISKTTREFVKQMGINTDSSHLNSTTTSTKKIDLEPETHMFAWITLIKHLLPVRSNAIWNPTVLKSLQSSDNRNLQTPAKEIVHQIKFSSPITSEEPSHESQKLKTQPKKRVEINLIQPATMIKAEQKQENTQQIPQIKTDIGDPDDIDIDALIARFRQSGETDIEATLQPIIHKFNGKGKKEEKLEAFLREVIAKNQMLRMVKQEQHPVQHHPYSSIQKPVSHQSYQQTQPHQMGFQQQPITEQSFNQHHNKMTSAVQQQKQPQQMPYQQSYPQIAPHEMRQAPIHNTQQYYNQGGMSHPRPPQQDYIMHGIRPPQQQTLVNPTHMYVQGGAPPNHPGFPGIRPPAPPLSQAFQQSSIPINQIQYGQQLPLEISVQNQMMSAQGQQQQMPNHLQMHHQVQPPQQNQPQYMMHQQQHPQMFPGQPPMYRGAPPPVRSYPPGVFYDQDHSKVQTHPNQFNPNIHPQQQNQQHPQQQNQQRPGQQQP